MSAGSVLQYLSKARLAITGVIAVAATGMCVYSIVRDAPLFQSTGFAVVALLAWLSVSAMFTASRQ